MDDPVLRIVIADDHAVVRSGLRVLLDLEPGFAVVGEAGSLEATREQVAEHLPDVLILDLHLGAHTSLDGIPALCAASPGMQVLVLTMQDDPAFARQALRAGARGYILKEAPRDELVDAVRVVASGSRYLHPDFAARVVTDGPDVELTARELEILRLIALGHTNAEVAGTLFISIRTVETHRANLHAKLGVSGRAELVRCALQRELIGP